MLIDRYLSNDAIEVDVDCIADGERRSIMAGVMEHIEEAGYSFGRFSACCAAATIRLSPAVVDEPSGQQTDETGAARWTIRGLMNVQYAIKDGEMHRAGGEPSGVADGAVRGQGDRVCRWPRSGRG